MSKKIWIITAIVALGFGGLIYAKQNAESKVPVIGEKHANQGQQHIARGEKHISYNSDLASSGPHYADAQSPAAWGLYAKEIPAEVFIHNEEHGGIIVTYQPDLLSQDQLEKLQALFAPPYSNKAFSPRKFIVMPRVKNSRAIQLVSWNYTLNLDRYNEVTIIKFFTQHVGRAPEALAGPSNTPINQSAASETR